MALRFSNALRNFKLNFGPVKRALTGGVIEVYSGSQPTTANDAVTGTLLVTFTKSGGAFTPEVLASGTVTLNTGASGSVDTLTVNSVAIIGASVPFNTSLTQTAADLAAAINAFQSSPKYQATSSGAVVTIKALPGTGTQPNGYVVASTATTITKTDVNMAGGVAAVNGLGFGSASGGVMSKAASETWQGTAVATGTAGWFRYKGSVSDAGGADSTETYLRMDGNIATSGANLNMSNTSITSGAVQTLSSFSLTDPAA